MMIMRKLTRKVKHEPSLKTTLCKTSWIYISHRLPPREGTIPTIYQNELKRQNSHGYARTLGSLSNDGGNDCKNVSKK